MSVAADATPEAFALLRLKLTPSVGPVLIDRLLERFESATRAVSEIERHGASALAGLERIGATTARTIAGGLARSERAAREEVAELARIGARLVGRADDDYPPLLRATPGAPATLGVRGELHPERDRYAVAIVGSRRCSAYGVEQAQRFAAALGQAGLTVVSGGARGVDTHAHAAALRAGGRTVVVLGCGLAHCYPPENRDLFSDVLAAGGAVMSELPATAPPEAKNFPARNRIISGMSLGVLVVEAGRKSGALITARLAAEEQGREVLAIPGRVDAPESEGCLDLLRQGAALAAGPADVLEALETPARHAHDATHAERYTPAFSHERPAHEPPTKARPLPLDLSESQRTICEALEKPLTLDELARATGLSAETLRAETTMLELRRVLTRDGARFARGNGR